MTAEVVVNTGSLSPICTRAFSRLRARSVGLASRLVLPTLARSRATSAGLATRPRKPLLDKGTRSAAPGTAKLMLSGHCKPTDSTSSDEISITSTASMTSGSGRSSMATSCSTMRTTSGVSRTTTELSLSSTCRSRVLAMVRTSVTTWRASALVRNRLRVTSSWCSRCLAGVFG